MLNFYILIGVMLIMLIGLSGVEANAKLWKIIVYSIFGAILWPVLLVVAMAVSIVHEIKILHQGSKGYEPSPDSDYDDSDYGDSTISPAVDTE